MLKKQVSPKIVAIVFAVIVVCFAIAVYVSAWTEPTAVPPGANVSAPLNVSGTGQAKAGGLVIHSSSSFEDPANPNALLIPYGNVGIGTANLGTNRLKIEGGTTETAGGLIIEKRTTNPGSPATGQMWLCTDTAPFCQ